MGGRLDMFTVYCSMREKEIDWKLIETWMTAGRSYLYSLPMPYLLSVLDLMPRAT
jgi:hypothetical protein